MTNFPLSETPYGGSWMRLSEHPSRFFKDLLA